MKAYLIPLVAAASLLVGCNQSVEKVSEQFNALPPEVQKSVRAQAPNDEIIAVTQKSQDGAQVYEIQFRENGNTPKMVVAADGRVISSEMPNKPAGTIQKLLTPTGAVGTKLSALPEKVQAAVQANAPNAPISSVLKHEDNGVVSYEIQFQEPGKNPTLRVAEDGTLVQPLQK